MVFGCQTCFLSFFILKNKKLFLKTVVKQESFHVSLSITLVIAEKLVFQLKKKVHYLWVKPSTFKPQHSYSQD